MVPFFWVILFFIATSAPWAIHWFNSRNRSIVREAKTIIQRPKSMSEAMAGKSMAAYLEKYAMEGSKVCIASGYGIYPEMVDILEPGRKKVYFDSLESLMRKGADVYVFLTHPSPEAKALWKEVKISQSLEGKLKVVCANDELSAETFRIVSALETFHPSVILNDNLGHKGAIWLERYHPAQSGIAHSISCYEEDEINNDLDSSLISYKSMFDAVFSESTLIRGN